jgi:hypothetical protein
MSVKQETGNRQVTGYMIRKQGTGNRKQETGNRKQDIGYRNRKEEKETGAGNKKQEKDTGNRKRDTGKGLYCMFNSTVQ